VTKRAKPRAKKRDSLLSTLARAAIILVFLVIAALAFLFEQGNQAEAPVRPTTAPSNSTTPPTGSSSGGRTAISGGLIQAFFTTPTLVYPDRRDQRGGSPLLEAVIEDINAAQRSIDLAVFDIDLDDLTDALIAAKQRGLTVRLVVDSENLEAAEVAEMTGRMQQADIPITFDDREAFMHNKFIVIDRRIAWLGSWNMTENDTYRNNNNMIRLRSQLAADAYRTEFETMFNGTFGGRKPAVPRRQIVLDETPVAIYFSPEDGAAKYVIEQINNAKSSIRFMAFSFTSADIANAMIAREQEGISVQGVMERQNASGVGAVFDLLKQNKIDVLVDGNCYILHHKTIIIDDQIVITGSYNFTRSAERENDENLVIISDPELAQLYLEEYDRIRNLAEQPLRCG
jgi:phosphatidylserine/phosphatidylglycerophosphate/cardiolipin synthase-like enzyme